MTRRSIGVVEFRDLRFNAKTQLIITRVPSDDRTNIFLNQNDPEVGGVLGAGDLEVGLNRENTQHLLTLVQRAISTAVMGNRTWQTIGEAEFSWSDHDYARIGSGNDQGTILIESNGSATRMVFTTKKWDWAPYGATFSNIVLDELSALLSRALSESSE